jgi:transposase
MEKEILFVGLDVDSKAIHGYLISGNGEAQKAFVCKPSSGALLKKLNELNPAGEFLLKVCYEASRFGYALYRALREKKIFCEVIAPSLIPRMAGRQTKTDRVDAQKLAEFYRKGLLTAIHVPEEKEEIIRDLVRSRDKIVRQRRGLKNQILALCAKNNLNFREDLEKPGANYWTLTHTRWLDRKIGAVSDPILQLNLKLLILNLSQLEEIISRYEAEIERISQDKSYQKKVEALRCFRGIDTQGAMAMITELGDIQRFNHPKKLASYAGMDIREYSSGGKERKFSITKMGSSRLRTTVIEACQSVWKTPNVGRAVKERRENVDEKIIAIADRCMLRLHKKSTRLLFAGKNKNKIKVACAREMLCFVWEALRAAA